MNTPHDPSLIGQALNAADRALATLRNRRLSAESTPLQEDLRRLGLVFIGAGFLAGLLQGQWLGVAGVAIGAALSYLGLTEKDQ